MSKAKEVEVSCQQTALLIDKVRHKQAELQGRLLGVAAKVDAVVLRNKSETKAEASVFRVLTLLRDYMRREAHVQDRLDRLVLVQRMRADAMRADAGAATRTGLLADADDVGKLTAQLGLHHQGLEQLMVILRRDIRDLEIMKNKVEADAATRDARAAPRFP